MTKLRTIAKAGGWEVMQDANGVVSIRFGMGMWICDHASAYEAIKEEVKDPTIRTELLRQWSDDCIKTSDAEAQTARIERVFGIGRRLTKDLVEELGE